MVEVVFTRSNRSSIRPVELGRRLLREIDDHRSVDVHGRRTVPNSFTFHLSPRDHAGFAEIEHALNHELCEAAREYARDEGYHLIGPVSVRLLVDNDLKPGRFGVQSQMREATAPASIPFNPAPEPIDLDVFAPAPAPPAEPPMVVPFEPASVSIPEPLPDAGPPVVIPPVIPPMAAPNPDPAPEPASVPAAPAAAPASARLQLPSGQRVNIDAGIVSIGRLPDCTVSLTDPNVSRRHAEVHPGSQVVVVDLGSTNGTKVNGLRIAGRQVLADGDIISLGSTHLRFEAARASA